MRLSATWLHYRRFEMVHVGQLHQRWAAYSAATRPTVWANPSRIARTTTSYSAMSLSLVNSARPKCWSSEPASSHGQLSRPGRLSRTGDREV